MSDKQVGMVKRRSKKGRKEVPPFTDHLEKHITERADLLFSGQELKSWMIFL